MNDVTLPWPPKELNPNARGHWSKRSKAAKAYRKACWALALQAGIKIDWEGDVHLWLTFFPPDLRHRDDDNMIASFKSGRDGLADALGINDKRFRIHPHVTGGVGGKIYIRFSPGPDSINGQQAGQPGEGSSLPPTPTPSTAGTIGIGEG